MIFSQPFFSQTLFSVSIIPVSDVDIIAGLHLICSEIYSVPFPAAPNCSGNGLCSTISTSLSSWLPAGFCKYRRHWVKIASGEERAIWDFPFLIHLTLYLGTGSTVPLLDLPKGRPCVISLSAVKLRPLHFCIITCHLLLQP